MSRSARRKQVKSSIRRRPRFTLRLEVLESRYAPSCTYYPSTGSLVGTGNDVAQVFNQPTFGRVDIYCNYQYAGSNYGAATTFYPGANSSILIDDTLTSGGGTYSLYDFAAVFGHVLYFAGPINNVDF